LIMIEAKIKQVIADVVKSTRNLPDIDVQRALTKAAPFHRGHVAMWKKYGLEIFKQTGRKMYGHDYNDKGDPTIKRKNRV